MANFMTPDDKRWMPLFLQQQRFARIKRAGGSTEPLPEFDYLVMLGSSTTAEVYSNNTVLGRQEQSVRKSSAG